MPLPLVFALGVALVAADASPQVQNTEGFRQKYAAEVDDWKFALDHEDGVVIEHLPSRGISKAMFIPFQPGGVQIARTVSTSGARSVGRVSSAAITELIDRSEPFNGYRYTCRCFDATSVQITIARHGKHTVLWAYGLSDIEKSPAASVIRGWEITADKIAASQ